MDDSPLLLDLKCPRRTVVFYVATFAPVLGLFLAMLVFGENDRGQALTLVAAGVFFALLAGMSDREYKVLLYRLNKEAKRPKRQVSV